MDRTGGFAGHPRDQDWQSTGFLVASPRCPWLAIVAVSRRWATSRLSRFLVSAPHPPQHRLVCAVALSASPRVKKVVVSSEAAGVARWFQKWLWQHAGDAHVRQMPDHTHIIMLSVDDMITPFFSFHLSPTLSPSPSPVSLFSLSLSLVYFMYHPLRHVGDPRRCDGLSSCRFSDFEEYRG